MSTKYDKEKSYQARLKIENPEKWKQQQERKKAYNKQFEQTHRVEIRKTKQKYYLKNKQRVTARLAKWRKENRARFIEIRDKSIYALKDLVFEKYGNKCECCGETISKFLTLDHKDGISAHERRNGKRIYAGRMLHKKLRDEGWPDYIRILCFNCNCGRSVNHGICPHISEML